MDRPAYCKNPAASGIMSIFTNDMNIFAGTYPRVVTDCLTWMDSDFTYPDHVTDVIIFHQCTDGQEETLRKVKIFKVTFGFSSYSALTQ